VHNAAAGLHVSAWLPLGISDVEVVKQLEENGLTATALSTCYAGGAARSGLLLGFGGCDERALERATATLGRILAFSR
jgi:GntR family transcriptional regulator/MocR family aminotransferase